MRTLLALFFIVLGFSANAQYAYENEMNDLLIHDAHEAGNLIAIVEGGKVVYEAYRGMASMEHGVALSPESTLDIGTMAMHFTAACIMQLESEGKLNLEDLVSTHLPTFPTYPEGSINIQHLLNHTSGIRDYVSLLMASGQSFNETHTQESVLEFIKKQRALSIRPGSAYRFSQSNYVLLAAIVEKVSGMKYARYLEQQFLLPFGMTSTYVYDDPSLLMKNRANAYQFVEDKWRLDQRYNFTVYGDGRIYSSLADLGRWATNIQQSPLYAKITERGYLDDGSLMTYACGLEYGMFNGAEIFAHNGYFGGFTAMYMHFMKEDKTIITLGNRWGFSSPGSAYDAANIIVPRKGAEGAIAEAVSYMEVDKQALERYAGSYFYSNYGYVRELYVENDTLTYIINEEVTRKLLPISENEFVAAGQSPRTVWKFEDGKMLVLNEGKLLYSYENYEKAHYSAAEMEEMEGRYYSEELDVEYELKEEDGNLYTLISGQEISVFQPVYKDVFTSAHDGYIKVSNDRFVLNDYSLGSVTFMKRG